MKIILIVKIGFRKNMKLRRKERMEGIAHRKFREGRWRRGEWGIIGQN